MAYIGRQQPSGAFLKLQGIIEYLQQTGVEMPTEEAPEVAPAEPVES